MDNWKFSELEYVRPDAEAIKARYVEATHKVKDAKSADEIVALIKECDEYDDKLQTMVTLVYVRNTLDTTDKFYEDEMEFINNTVPELMPYIVAFGDAVSMSPFRDELEKRIGKQFLPA